MKYFSMFTGIGGFELGIQYADRSSIRGSKENTPGNEGEGLLSPTGQDISSTNGRSCERPDNLFDERPLCVGYSEIDKYAIQTFEHHFGKEVKNYGDATKLNTDELPDFDLLVGGFPCQAFSLAGKRAGFEDTRGTLIFDVVRVLRDKRPRHFVLENVKGLLSHEGGKTFAAILEILTDSGYDVSWSIHNSKNYGVPQNRERIYLIGNLRGEPRPQVFPLRASNQEAVVSNTNLTPNHEKRLSEIAGETGALFEIKSFLDVPLATCIVRNAQRVNPVPETAIRSMYKSFVKPKMKVAEYVKPPYNPDLPNCIIVDIDGTLAHMTGRSPYDYTKVHTDVVDENVAQLVRKYAQRDVIFETPDTYIIIVSGRDDTCKDETLKWLADNNIPFDEFYMRDHTLVDEKGNKLDDTVIKKNIYEDMIKPRFNVRFVLDDRDRVVKMWREQGLKVLQVAEGDF